jgi:Ca2+-transporting ATPase
MTASSPPAQPTAERNIGGEPHARGADEILDGLGVTREDGLSRTEVGARRRRFGSNLLQETKTKSALAVLAEQFKSLIVLLLVAAAAVSLFVGDWLEAIAIGLVILINTAIGFVTEIQAVRTMEALRKSERISTKVRRRGKILVIAASELVPGDIVLVEGGDRVTADVRLLQASKLQTDESTLTGESLPVTKRTETVVVETPLAERTNMLFKGTAITRGEAEGVVVATGMNTELGRITTLTEQAEGEATPLERRLERLGRKLIYVTLALSVGVAAAGIGAGKSATLMLQTAIALAVAAIPEGLPIVATLALARGMLRMARRRALIRRLAAVETLGATNVICTDKTGTLTENRMSVALIRLNHIDVVPDTTDATAFREADGERLGTVDALVREALEVGALCNHAQLPNGTGTSAVGEPLEIALAQIANRAGIRRDDLIRTLPEVREVAFDPEEKMMATYHGTGGRYYIAVKGAPEAVLEASSSYLTLDGERPLDETARREWSARAEQAAQRGLRMLALARKWTGSESEAPYRHLTWIGLVGFMDPPRKDVPAAIDACRAAGIRVIMVTGDRADTAKSVAATVRLGAEDQLRVTEGTNLEELDRLSPEARQSLLDADVFARVSPKQKLELVRLRQGGGDVVAMTGDGVNDAPALKKADIGVAMGQRGTQVAREVADMILQDDAFPTIVAAVQQGRVIFDNIRSFVFYLLSCNASEILVVAVASILNAPLPLLPLQILFLNLVTDVFPALAIGMNAGSAEVMRRPPRSSTESIVTREVWVRIAAYGVVITLAVLGAFWIALEPYGLSTERAVTISFLTLAFAQLLHVFNVRAPGSRLLSNEVTRNPNVWGALVLCTLLLLGGTYVPILRDVLDLVVPTGREWLLIGVMSAVPLVVGQSVKSFRRPRGLTRS